jgi:SH3-like domain-containing protein
VYRNIRKHFEGQEWINKDILSEKWNAISVCITPETTYNEMLRVNAECANVGLGHIDVQMATKFGHLLQTHHPTAYIGVFTDLARAGSDATIQMLWHSAQITSNALARNAIINPVSHQIGQQARAPRSAFRNSTPSAQFTPQARVKCDWCGGPHPLNECYNTDCTNVQRFPNPN